MLTDSAGFDDWSLDLIFALPPEINRSWMDDLHRAIDYARLQPRGHELDGRAGPRGRQRAGRRDHGLFIHGHAGE